jgi:hypothetical protein
MATIRDVRNRDDDDDVRIRMVDVRIRRIVLVVRSRRTELVDGKVECNRVLEIQSPIEGHKRLFRVVAEGRWGIVVERLWGNVDDPIR